MSVEFPDSDLIVGEGHETSGTYNDQTSNMYPMQQDSPIRYYAIRALSN